MLGVVPEVKTPPALNNAPKEDLTPKETPKKIQPAAPASKTTTAASQAAQSVPKATAAPPAATPVPKTAMPAPKEEIKTQPQENSAAPRTAINQNNSSPAQNAPEKSNASAPVSPPKQPVPDIFFPIMNPDADERTVTYTMPGTIDIELAKTGWIYIGEKNGKRGIALDSRNFVNGNTVFTFKITENDDYHIVFQLQNTSGEPESSEVFLRRGEPGNTPSVAIDTNPAPAQTQPQAGTGNSASQPNSSLAAAPNMPAASNTASSSSSASSPSPAPAPQPQADNSVPQDAIKIAATYADSGNYIAAIDLLERTLQSYPAYPEMDKIYYLLAKYYEAETSKRSAVKSVYYYNKILDEFPLSDYRDESEQRIKYLEKHFIYIN